jgi:hypothetical protein
MIVINSNGSKGSGDTPDQIAALLDRLAGEPLNPTLEAYGNFVMPARAAAPAIGDDGKVVYADLGPIYSEAPNAIRFTGNFYRVSAVFGIDTDEPELIEKLTAAIRANQATPAYKAAKRAQS